MEFSRLLFDGTPELHFANFLHMITTMAESGSTTEQIEFFILNSQNMPKLPDEGSVWELSSSSLMETDNLQPSEHVPLTNIFQRRKTQVNSNWPPADWKTAPDFTYARASGFKTQAAQTSSCLEMKNDDFETVNSPPVCTDPETSAADWTIKDEPEIGLVTLHESDDFGGQSGPDRNQTDSNLHVESDCYSLEEAPDEPRSSSSTFSRRERLQTGTFDAAQTKVTGRLGELLACKYFVGKFGNAGAVRWVNEVDESGLPYDLLITQGTSIEYVEVKATRSSRKDWFIISQREWQYAVERGEYFSIAHVQLMENNVARITIFKDPVKLCQRGELQLAVMMPRQPKEFSIVS